MFSILDKWLYPSIQKISFEDIQDAIKTPQLFVMINTLKLDEQKCLIQNTLPVEKEEMTMNAILENKEDKRKIIIYGKHNMDESVDKKYKQLIQLGFIDIYVYTGGLFEWLLLQDIYGSELFPTTTKCTMELLNYRPPKMFY